MSIWEDDHRRTIRFQNAPNAGMFRRFEGLWRVQQYQEPRTHGPGGAAAQPQPWALPNLGAALSSAMGRGTTMLTLTQQIVPKALPLPGLKGLVQGLIARQAAQLLEDIRVEVQRRKAATGRSHAEHQALASKVQQHKRQHHQPRAPAAACTTLRNFQTPFNSAASLQRLWRQHCSRLSAG